MQHKSIIAEAAEEALLDSLKLRVGGFHGAIRDPQANFEQEARVCAGRIKKLMEAHVTLLRVLDISSAEVQR